MKAKTETKVSRLGSLERPATSSINCMKRLYRKLCEEQSDPQRIAQAMELALRVETEDTWRMKEGPMWGKLEDMVHRAIDATIRTSPFLMTSSVSGGPKGATRDPGSEIKPMPRARTAKRSALRSNI